MGEFISGFHSGETHVVLPALRRREERNIEAIIEFLPINFFFIAFLVSSYCGYTWLSGYCGGAFVTLYLKKIETDREKAK